MGIEFGIWFFKIILGKKISSFAGNALHVVTANKRGERGAKQTNETTRVLSPNCILLSKWLSTPRVVSGTMLYIPWKRKLSSFLSLVRAPSLLRTAISPPRLSSFFVATFIYSKPGASTLRHAGQ